MRTMRNEESTACEQGAGVSEDDEVAIDVCSYCFENVHMSMFGIVDEFCSGKCADAWQEWWQGAKQAQSS